MNKVVIFSIATLAMVSVGSTYAARYHSAEPTAPAPVKGVALILKNETGYELKARIVSPSGAEKSLLIRPRLSVSERLQLSSLEGATIFVATKEPTKGGMGAARLMSCSVNLGSLKGTHPSYEVNIGSLKGKLECKSIVR